MSLGPDRAKSRGNKSMHISCSIDFGSATPLSPRTTAVFPAVRPSVYFSLPPSSTDLPLSCPPFYLFCLSSPSFQTSSHHRPSSLVQSGLRGSHEAWTGLLPWQRSFQFSPGFPAYRVDIIKAPSQRRAHLLSCPFYTFPSFFPPLFVSPFLSRSPPPSLLLAHCRRI